MDRFRDRYVYSSEGSNSDQTLSNHPRYWMEDSPPLQQQTSLTSRFPHLLSASNNLSSAFNACANDPDFDLASLLRYSSSSDSSISSSMRSSSNLVLTPNARSRSPYSSPLKVEFNEDVLVMDGVILNGSLRTRSSSSLFPSARSSSSVTGGGKYHHHFPVPSSSISSASSSNDSYYESYLPDSPCNKYEDLYDAWIQHLGRRRDTGRVPAPVTEMPASVGTSVAMWNTFYKEKVSPAFFPSGGDVSVTPSTQEGSQTTAPSTQPTTPTQSSDDDEVPEEPPMAPPEGLSFDFLNDEENATVFGLDYMSALPYGWTRRLPVFKEICRSKPRPPIPAPTPTPGNSSGA